METAETLLIKSSTENLESEPTKRSKQQKEQEKKAVLQNIFSEHISKFRSNPDLLRETEKSLKNFLERRDEYYDMASAMSLTKIEHYYHLLINKKKCTTKIESEKLSKRNVICKWTKYDNVVFFWLVLSYSNLKQISIEKLAFCDWEYISKFFPDYTGIKLKLKWFSFQKSKAQQGLWIKEEELLLAEIIQKQPQPYQWTTISEEFNLKSSHGVTRLAKHCREKWLNYLNPELKKGDWQLDEDKVILETVLTEGTKWAEISKLLKCRNENSVKNRYLSLMGLHAISRTKIQKFSEEMKEAVQLKLSDIREEIAKRDAEKWENTFLQYYLWYNNMNAFMMNLWLYQQQSLF